MSQHPTGHTSRRRGSAAVLAAAALVLAGIPAVVQADVAGAPGGAGRLPVIKGKVGPGFDISLDQESVPAGRYKLVVRDRGTIHNFQLFGDGVFEETDVTGTGRWVWRVTLQPGTYYAVCVPHGSMSTTLQVT